MKTKKANAITGLMISTILLFSFVPRIESVISENDNPESIPIYGNWKTFGTKDGLPSDKIFAVRVDEGRVWVGTDKGLAVLENGRWTTYTEEDGLAHRSVLSIDVSQLTGDVWIGTMSGLNRFSGGKFETFDQFNSGLANDVIYTVICDGKDIWTATGGGASVLDTYTGKWRIFTEQNAPMHEPWTYSVCEGNNKIFIAAWGGGVIEWNKQTEVFRDYTDPDGEMEIDLFPDDGIVHDITTAVSYSDNMLWVATYFGMSTYDGNHWKGYFDHDSGLASNFINYVRAKDGIAWICTDNGLSSFNGKTWVTYKGGKVIIDGNSANERIMNAASTISHDFTMGVDIEDNIIWVATSKGLSRAEVIGSTETRTSKL
jgi:ligand-binding sensor domain-containing protein